MVIKELLEQVGTATSPAVKLVRKGEGFKVLAVAFQKGMLLDAHKTSLPTRVVVVQGRIHYRQDGDSWILQQYEDHEIPVGVLHTVEALEDSLIFLVQGA